MSKVATPLRDITNSHVDEIVASKWCGNHIKFDDNGNTEEVVKTVEAEVEDAEDLQEIKLSEDEAQTEEDEESVLNEDDDKENSEMWALRSRPRKQPAWTGTHTKFVYDGEGEEYTQETVSQTQEIVMDLQDSLAKLSTRDD
eukprot:TRINITY_DN17887_c0_g1_i1.p1 TRINITY_DN17887_c0_g1~~TRINITY_DN17887_c0_g1_i1.p1  ORF type:complete len:155 (+),score=51.67 TRINITY_DN17887_c0_g1_i1:42-467(+)